MTCRSFRLCNVSIDKCHVCERLVDTDAEPEAYAEVANYVNVAHPVAPSFYPEDADWVCVCAHCRDEYVCQDGLFWKGGAPNDANRIMSEKFR